LASTKLAFTAKSETNEDDSDDIKGRCSVINKSTQTEIKCLDVINLVQSPSEEGVEATFFGNVEVKIGSGKEARTQQVTYRIDVDDLAEPNKGKGYLQDSDRQRLCSSRGFTRREYSGPQSIAPTANGFSVEGGGF
jgi:hypothetical protein